MDVGCLPPGQARPDSPKLVGDSATAEAGDDGCAGYTRKYFRKGFTVRAAGAGVRVYRMGGVTGEFRFSKTPEVLLDGMVTTGRGSICVTETAIVEQWGRTCLMHCGGWSF